jgi:hypothetical protein
MPSIPESTKNPILERALYQGGKLAYDIDNLALSDLPDQPQADLLYLNSNISIEPAADSSPEASKNLVCSLSTSARKTAFILSESVSQLALKYGIERVGFLTLTFAEHITCHKKAQKRLNSLLSNVINKKTFVRTSTDPDTGETIHSPERYYADYIGCVERQSSGRIHYHLLLIMPESIACGFDFKAAANRDYSSASPYLRSQWAFWRKTAKLYGFGRTELLPVRTNMDAMAKYVGKYIGKHMENRHHSDKGARLVRFSRGARAGTTRFMFNSVGASDWRRKVATFVQIVQTCFDSQPNQSRSAHLPPSSDPFRSESSTNTIVFDPERLLDLPDDFQIKELSDLSLLLGKKWAYNNREFILSLP